MRLPGWAWLALSSFLVSSCLTGAVRPRYGGTLTVELSSGLSSMAALGGYALSIPVAETLVRVNSHGEIEPMLAVAWQHDADYKRWRFSLRPKVTFHDGEALTGASAAPSLAAALKAKYGEVSIEAGGQALVVQSDRAMPDLLEELALPGAVISRKSDTDVRKSDDALIGTGPFRVTGWEPGRHLTLAAFDDYWGGRPYLDSVEIEFGAGRGHADLFDIPVGPARRILPEGLATWSSAPRILVAITAANPDPIIAQALSLLIDRSPIASVLAQHKGDPAFGLLPQWLSGYAFLFQTALDITRAKQLVSALRLGSISLSYPANDLFLRSVAERVALNARDAGLIIQPTSAGNANLRLIEWPLESTDATNELRRIAELAGAGDRARQLESAKPETLYELERSLVDDHRIIPLVYLRETYGIAPRVHFQPAPQTTATDMFALHLEDAWVDQRAGP
jgi:peptide/nickel transport system substrate-binding protein